MYDIKPMEDEEALEIITWKYGGIYDFYSFSESREVAEEMLRDKYYSVRNMDGELIGYYCFGVPAQVPAGNEYGAYDDKTALDIGLGMKPQLTGSGRGVEFVKSGVEFARKNMSATKMRLTVAAFNQRAIRVYEKVSFKKGMIFERLGRANGKGVQFLVMNLE